MKKHKYSMRCSCGSRWSLESNSEVEIRAHCKCVECGKEYAQYSDLTSDLYQCKECNFKNRERCVLLKQNGEENASKND